jgi:hypothetical protein
MTGGGSQASQTPSATATLSSGGAPSFPGLGTFSGAGAASTPGLTVTGAPYTGGSATTNFPQFYMNDGTGPTTFSTAGTEFGVNAPSGFTGNFLDFHVNGGASVASLSSTGALTVASCTGCGGAATSWQDYGYQSGSSAVTAANATDCVGVIFPIALSVGHVVLNVATADATNNSDFGIYNSSGTLEAHIGAQHLGTGGVNTLAFSGGTQSIPAGKSYACLTSVGTTVALSIFQQNITFFTFATVSSATTGGSLNSTITPPADTPGFSANVFAFILEP